MVLRRLVHCLVALAPLYYLLPVEMPGTPIHRWHLLIALFAAIMTFEAVRLRRRITFLGLRPHERDSMASFAWAAAGITAALWFMPMEVATPVLIGMALTDPLAGELRRLSARRSMQVAIPWLVYAAICVISISVMVENRFPMILAISILGASLAIASERLKIPVVDDDFLMIVVPGGLMSLLWLSG